jgi:hypothetical protein
MAPVRVPVPVFNALSRKRQKAKGKRVTAHSCMRGIAGSRNGSDTVTDTVTDTEETASVKCKAYPVLHHFTLHTHNTHDQSRSKS